MIRRNINNGLGRCNQNRPFDGRGRGQGNRVNNGQHNAVRLLDGSGKGEGRGLGKIDGKCRYEK